MILNENLHILKSTYSDMLSSLISFEDVKNKKLTNVEEAKNGELTLSIKKDDKKTYLHSKYNPIREAKTIIESIENMDSDTNIIFYGTGLGHHIQLILEKYKNVKYYVYEPIPELMHSFLSTINLKNLDSSRMMGLSTKFGEENLNKFIDRNREKLIVVELPAHIQNFPKEWDLFNEALLELIAGKRRSIATNYSMQKRWIINSVKNFKEVLSTPNIIEQKKGAFKGKTAILVAAGPSLNDEIENLKKIKQTGSAYIFSVGSAINTLIHHNIYPDAACTYDPTVKNQIVFEQVKERKIKDIPMIFGSSVGYETLENYPGEKFHMMTSQDTVASYFLKSSNSEPISIVYDAPSIAVVTLQLLGKMGFSNVLLVGQNLGYRGKDRYSEGISYSTDLTETEINNGLWVKDVHGQEILTNDGFNTMRKEMERIINSIPDTKVINTTKGGAHIQGTEFLELKKVMDKQLNTKIVDTGWLDKIQTDYDMDYLTSQVRKMDRSYDKALNYNKEYKIIISKIKNAIKNRKFTNAEKQYINLNKQLKRIENNDFYKVFILPMNRTQYKVLVDSIDTLNMIADPIKKGESIVNSFSGFLDICLNDIELVSTIYEEFKEEITS